MPGILLVSYNPRPALIGSIRMLGLDQWIGSKSRRLRYSRLADVEINLARGKSALEETQCVESAVGVVHFAYSIHSQVARPAHRSVFECGIIRSECQVVRVPINRVIPVAGNNVGVRTVCAYPGIERVGGGFTLRGEAADL